MTYNSNEQSLYADARYLCGIAYSDTTTFTITDFTRLANEAVKRVETLIMRSDNTWEWDDLAATDMPIGDTDLVSGQGDYALAVTHLRMIRVRVKDSSGQYRTLQPKNRRLLTDDELNASGMPTSYDLLGNSIILTPTPISGAVTLSDGLEIQVQRPSTLFTTSDTTATPGFIAQFHRLVSLYPALEFCELNEMNNRAAAIRAKIGAPPDERNGIIGTGMEGALVELYTTRDRDTQVGLRAAREDYGQDEMSNPNGW